MDANTLPWTEKYRPKTLNEILSQEHIVTTLKKVIKKRNMHHLLFYGPPGVGKTSAIVAAAKELYGIYYNFMVLEINASDDRGIELVRTKIKQFVSCKNVLFGECPEDRKGIFKLVILDETDAMTVDAQAILRKVVEKYTQNTRFCLICNYIQKIDPALQSRCTKFRFSPINKFNIKKKISEVGKKENLNVTKQGITTIIKRSNGDMRKVLNTLQSVSMVYKTINEKNVNACMGYPQRVQMEKIIKSLFTYSFKDSYILLQTFINDDGLSLNDIVEEINNIFTDYLMGDNTSIYIDHFTELKVLNILNKMRNIEYNQSINTNDRIQLGALVGLFNVNK